MSQDIRHRILIMAGGTGGHIFPGLAVAERLKEMNCDVQWLGAAGGMEDQLVPAHGIQLHRLSISGLRGKSLATLTHAPLRLWRAVRQAMRVIKFFDPALILGFGGFASGPGGIAARLARKPLVIHEQNAIAGMTNRYLHRWSQATLQAFPGAFAEQSKVITTGNPVRATIASIDQQPIRQPLHLLVMGGSRGAQILNQTLPLALSQLPLEARPKVRHQSGAGKLEELTQAYQQAGITPDADVQPVEFIDDMAEAYQWADVVIARAGALTISEIAAAGKASILVPYPHAVDDHQTHNAHYLSENGAAELLPQSQLSAQSLFEILSAITQNNNKVSDMAARAKSLAKPDATSQVVDVCLKVLGGAHG